MKACICAGMCPPANALKIHCAQVMKKKAKPVKGKPAGRMLTKTEPCASFFNFFSPPAVPEDPNEVDEDEMEELQHAMEEDYELGCARASPHYAPNYQMQSPHPYRALSLLDSETMKVLLQITAGLCDWQYQYGSCFSRILSVGSGHRLVAAAWM